MVTSTRIETIETAPAAVREPRVLPHAYDGIREYDNPLPGWWKLIFYASIVFAAGYFVAYQLTGWGATPEETYRAALSHYASSVSGPVWATASEESLRTGVNDSKMMARGADVFAARCASCHTADGRGLIGPNLTDLYQLHGTTRLDLFTTIRDGVPNTAMPSWGEQLPAEDIVSVAVFVTTLRGKNLPGKAPQGQKVQSF
jgi:cytochrome c oxidase cbb3-type subunit 3